MKASPSGIKFQNGTEYAINEGMDLRDYFAAKAMQGQMSDAPIFGGISDSSSDFAKAVSKNAYAVADAMMEARKK